MRRIHVTDECIAVLDDDLPAPRYVGSADQFYIFPNTELRSVSVPFTHDFVSCSAG
jgi:hypothetical protein